MNQPDYADEPSMEEILASIRRIITQEQQPSEGAAQSDGASSVFQEDSHPYGDRPSLSSQTNPLDEKPASLGQQPENQSKATGADVHLLHEGSHDTVVKSKGKPAFKPESVQKPSPRNQGLEEFLATALRPLIREWLDEHMAGLVRDIAAEQVQEILYQKVFK